MNFLRLTFKDLYKPYLWEDRIYNLKVVGLFLKEPFHREDFIFQEIRISEGTYRFLYTEMPRLFFFSKRRLKRKIDELFSVVPQELIRRDYHSLSVFDSPVVKHICYPQEEDTGEHGVFFILMDGRQIFFPLKGKRIPSDIAFTLMHPLPLAPLFF